MPKKRLKTQSRRMTTKKLTKINKKVREHKRKMRKLKKHNPQRVSVQSLVKKESIIPNVMPFKEQVLREAEQDVTTRKEVKTRDYQLTLKRNVEREENRNLKRSLSRQQKLDLLMERAMIPGGFSMSEVNLPPLAERIYNPAQERKASVKDMTKTHFKDFKEVVRQSDIILQVLDARDPLGSRCQELENHILDAGPSKRLVLLLNKIDLIPRDNLTAWLKYLRNEYPTMPFKASTQIQRNNLKQQKGRVENLPEKAVKIRGCLGSDKLLQLFANYCRNKDIKTKITVGIVGFPNTGKSSVINSLKRSKACTVGAIPGVTRCVQRVYLDRHTWLLDSPGLVLSRDMSSVGAILHNCVNVNQIEDPIAPVEAILKRCNKEQMMMRYLITDYTDARHFLQLLAKRYGYVLTGGVPDITRAGKQILHEWNIGRIRYFTHPPKRSAHQTHEKSELVEALSKPFDLDSLLTDEETQLNSLKGQSRRDMIVDDVPSLASTRMEAETDPRDDAETSTQTDPADPDTAEKDTKSEEMQVDAEPMTVEFPEGKKRREIANEKQTDTDSLLPGNQRSNQQVKKDFKKMKKERKRADAIATCLSDALNSALPSAQT